MNEAMRCPCCGNLLVDDGRIRVDEESGIVVGGGRFAQLTRQEFDLFLTLWASRPRVFTKEALLSATAGIGFDDRDLKIVDVFVCKARKKLAPLGVSITTVWGTGYRITTEGVSG